MIYANVFMHDRAKTFIRGDFSCVCILAIKSGPYLVHLQLVRDIRRILSITGQTKPTVLQSYLYYQSKCKLPDYLTKSDF